MASGIGDGDRDEKAVAPAAAVEAPTSDESVTGGDAVEGEQNEDEKEPKLPFSKARCIALVATVTGASFMNVGLLPTL